MTPRRIGRVAIYARLSVTTEESVSIARQVESARAYAVARGWEVTLVAVDDGVSATKNKPEDRVGWRQVVDSPERFEAVIVWKVDRLARRVLDFLHADEALQKRGAGLVAVEDPIDMTSASGRAFATMLAVFGEMEAAAISARVSAARRQLVRDGRRVGGRPPFGYLNVPNPDGPGLVLAQDPETIGAVREAAARAAAGESLYSIARRLESMGVWPRARRRRDGSGSLEAQPRQATRWHEASVETMLRAPALAGMTPYTPGRVPGAKPGHEHYVREDVLRRAGLPVVDGSLAVMTPEEWRNMLAKIDAGKRPGSRPQAGAEVALLYGLARCGSCGGLLHRAQAGAGGKYTYYRCNDRGRVCTSPSCVSRPSLEAYVTARVLEVAGGLPVVRMEVDAPGEDALALSEIEAQIADTLARLGEVDDDTEAVRLNERLQSLKVHRRDARTPVLAPVTRAFETGRTFGEVFASQGTAEKRDALLAALEAVVVAPGGRGPKFDPNRISMEWRRGEDYDSW